MYVYECADIAVVPSNDLSVYGATSLAISTYNIGTSTSSSTSHNYRYCHNQNQLKQYMRHYSLQLTHHHHKCMQLISHGSIHQF